jgi:hypothetical protein
MADEQNAAPAPQPPTLESEIAKLWERLVAAEQKIAALEAKGDSNGDVAELKKKLDEAGIIREPAEEPAKAE